MYGNNNNGGYGQPNYPNYNYNQYAQGQYPTYPGQPNYNNYGFQNAGKSRITMNNRNNTSYW